MSPEEQLAEARSRVQRADDPTIWWDRRADGTVLTHRLLRDGTWELFLWDPETRTSQRVGEGEA